MRHTLVQQRTHHVPCVRVVPQHDNDLTAASVIPTLRHSPQATKARSIIEQPHAANQPKRGDALTSGRSLLGGPTAASRFTTRTRGSLGLSVPEKNVVILRRESAVIVRSTLDLRALKRNILVYGTADVTVILSCNVMEHHPVIAIPIRLCECGV